MSNLLSLVIEDELVFILVEAESFESIQREQSFDDSGYNRLWIIAEPVYCRDSVIVSQEVNLVVLSKGEFLLVDIAVVDGCDFPSSWTATFIRNWFGRNRRFVGWRRSWFGSRACLREKNIKQIMNLTVPKNCKDYVNGVTHSDLSCWQLISLSLNLIMLKSTYDRMYRSKSPWAVVSCLIHGPQTSSSG